MSKKHPQPTRRSSRISSCASTNLPSHCDQGKQQGNTPIINQDQTSTQVCIPQESSSDQQNMGSESGDKLDEILKNIKTICSDIKSMKADIGKVQTDMSNLKKSVKAVKKTADDALEKSEANERKISSISSDMQNMSGEMNKIRSENKQLKEKLIRAEAQDRRNNLLFDGCEEKENENCHEIVYNILEKSSPMLKVSRSSAATGYLPLGLNSHRVELLLVQMTNLDPSSLSCLVSLIVNGFGRKRKNSMDLIYICVRTFPRK